MGLTGCRETDHIDSIVPDQWTGNSGQWSVGGGS
jgi:hypothetical protein